MKAFTFDTAASEYNEVRPGYPNELFKDVIELSGIPQNGFILEIGSGTGQATLPLAKQGYSITCLEPGKNLIQIAQQKLINYPKVTFLNTTFEDWQIEKSKFHVITSATAFHWVDQKIGYLKVHSALNSMGKLALFWNKHPRPYTGFFEEVQQIYHKIVPEWPDPNNRQSDEDWINETQTTINSTGLFNQLKIRKYHWFKDYSSDAYIKLLSTYSDHISLEETRRKRLFTDIKNLIDSDFSGVVKRPYLTVLFISEKIGD